MISGNYTNSSTIRKLFVQEKNVTRYIPFETSEILDYCFKYGKIVSGMECFEKELIYVLRRMSCQEIANLADVTEGLENKIKSAANECNTIKDLITIVKSKRYTETRIQRILLYALLGITKQKMSEFYKIPPYIRILGMNKKGKELVSLSKQENPKLQFVTSVKDFLENTRNKTLREMLELDILATNIYTLGFDNEPYANLDFTKRLVIL